MREHGHCAIWVLTAVCSATLVAERAATQEMPAPYRAVLKELGRSGDFKDGVLKVNVPRNDLSMKVAGRALPTPFGFAGWLAITRADGGNEVMMGDLVLLPAEVNPVISALLDNGLEVTALHNHFFHEDPHIFFMHVHGHGTAMDLAQRVKPALELIGKGALPSATPATASPEQAAQRPDALDTGVISRIVGHTGEQVGSVYKITVARGDFVMKERGATINARMGLNSWAAFAGTRQNAAIAGDVAMLEREVTPVVKALRQNGLEVVAIHHHMTESPVVIFLHYWGQGPPESLATGFKAALDELGKGRSARRLSHSPGS